MNFLLFYSRNLFLSLFPLKSCLFLEIIFPIPYFQLKYSIYFQKIITNIFPICSPNPVIFFLSCALLNIWCTLRIWGIPSLSLITCLSSIGEFLHQVPVFLHPGFATVQYYHDIYEFCKDFILKLCFRLTAGEVPNSIASLTTWPTKIDYRSNHCCSLPLFCRTGLNPVSRRKNFRVGQSSRSSLHRISI